MPKKTPTLSVVPRQMRTIAVTPPPGMTRRDFQAWLDAHPGCVVYQDWKRRIVKKGK